MFEFLIGINDVLWVVGNLMVGYLAFAIPVFVIFYVILFDPRATTGGRLIFRFFLSMVGLIALVAIGIFVDPSPSENWTILPEDVEVWRPALRLLVYGYISFTVSSLVGLLIVRKWWPRRIKTAPERDLVRLRNTGQHPTIK